MAKVIASPSVTPGKYRTLQRAGTDESHPAPHDDVPQEEASVVSVNEFERMRTELYAQLEAQKQRADQAEQALTTYQTQMDELRLNAQKEGMEKGLEQASIESENALKEQLQSLSLVLQEMNVQRQQLLQEEAEKVAVEIGFHAAAKIIGLSLTDRAVVLGIVQKAMESVVDQNNLVVKLSHADFEKIRSTKDGDELGALTGIDIRPDSSIQFGGCIVESSAGALDARLELQLEAIKSALSEAHSKKQRLG